MSIIIDLAIVLIIALSIFLGYKRGLIKCVVSVLSFLIAIIVVIIFTKPITNLIIDNTTIDNAIKDSIASKVNIQDAEEYKVGNFLGVGDFVTNSKNEAIEMFSNTLTNGILTIGIAIILYVLTRFLLKFVKGISKLADKIPVLKQFNHVGGIIYGILSGILKVYAILAVLMLIIPFITNTAFLDAINGSFIADMMYNNNILTNIIL
jgi:uncharacterized membrane protein required for colicin V production